jgi:uncharacterized protein involved in exopolysaccharide biosynthesis
MPQETLTARREYSSTANELEETQDSQDIDLTILLAVILRSKKKIILGALATALLTALIVFFVIKPMYTAEAVFLPPQMSPGSGMAQLASQLGSLGSASSALAGGAKGPGDVYLGILLSRTVADNVVRRFDLQSVYKTKLFSDAIKVLHARSTFAVGKNTLITIDVDDHDPKRAADIANGYLDALREQNGQLALTEASQRRLFFEQQLEKAKNALADAEVELKLTQERTGLISPGGQAQVEIETTAQLRAQITSYQVELAALRQGATDDNPQVIRLQSQISGLQQQLQKMQNDSEAHQLGNLQLPTAKVPGLALEYVRKQREVRYHEVLFDMIARQYETARLDESREAPVLQIVDRAIVPDRKSGPKRALLTIGGFVVGGFLAMIWVLVKYAIARAKQDATRAARLDELRRAASF